MTNRQLRINSLSLKLSEDCNDKQLIVNIIRSLIEELGYDNFNLDGDHGMEVINVKDLLTLVDELK